MKKVVRKANPSQLLKCSAQHIHAAFNSTVFDISSCPITFYDKVYTAVYNAFVYVEGTLASSLTFALYRPITTYEDISGCRALGFGIHPDTSKIYDETCTKIFCGLNRYVTIEGCSDSERCDGSGICLVNNICTVTGPTVIDFNGTFSSVEDRCAYLLLQDSIFDIKIVANFQERRRKDVSFLDSVTLTAGEDVFHLEQGGRVLENNSPLTLNSTVQEINGLELFRDHTGVTVKMIQDDAIFSLFFNGDTVQLTLEEEIPPPVKVGLCRGSFSAARFSEGSSPSCDTEYLEIPDSTINCTTMTDRCNLLMEAPFSSCHDEVDPAPYVIACSDTLCRYPSVDGLRCQFLGAYARACHQNSSALEEWWSAAQCPPPEDFCQDKMCSDHEFCGEIRGKTGCLCRAIKASKYRESGTLGDPTVCTQNSALVSLLGCLLEEDNIDYTHLHLIDETCKGEKDEESHMVTFSFTSTDTCGAVITANGSNIIYKNSILSQNTSSDVIVRQDQTAIDFSCTHTQPEIKTVAFRIKDSSVVIELKSGAWNYTLTMKAYTDAGRTQVLDSSTDVVLNQKIWVELETDGLDEDLVAVVTDSCWATSQESSSSTPRYDLIQDGCPNTADQTVEVEGNGEGTFNYFSFNMFQFSGSSSEVYLHCKLELCVKQNNVCVPVVSMD
ncbi:alpha-tectorin-like [Leuresthes tenuis]|uniref:alpha-tectorin-like n=1 Tax=Leuresthes tenuis TaxID=355514 RepID=UPI003B510007